MCVSEGYRGLIALPVQSLVKRLGSCRHSNTCCVAGQVSQCTFHLSLLHHFYEEITVQNISKAARLSLIQGAQINNNIFIVNIVRVNQDIQLIQCLLVKQRYNF